MPTAFVRETLPGRVVFGAGARHGLGDEVGRSGLERIVVIASARDDDVVAEIEAHLGGRVVGRFSDVRQHVPLAQARQARQLVSDTNADGILTIGGGSATGFGKAVSLELDVVHIAVPTTYAGSEMTTIWGLTDGDHKSTGKDDRVLPDVVVYDPELTLGLPTEITGPSGMNALAHCVEALYGPGAEPVNAVLALEGARVLVAALPAVCDRPDDIDARAAVLYGAHLAGVVLAVGGTALHHKTCHVLGGMFGLDHGAMNAVVLGHAVRYTAPAIPDVISRLAHALDVTDPAAAMFDLAATIGAPTDLASIGMPEHGLDDAARRVVVEASANPRPPDRIGIRAMLDDAFHGRRPTLSEPVVPSGAGVR